MSRKQPNQVAIDGAAVICGLCCYFPYPGFRGAAFCLFPGMAQRSIGLAMKGAGIGFFADIAVTIACGTLRVVWEPRWGGFNYVLAAYLPPDNYFGSHSQQAMPNSMAFSFGLVAWMVAMYMVWIALWRPQIDWPSRIVILFTGALTVILCAALLWFVAPLHRPLYGYSFQPIGDLPCTPFLGVFLLTMPVCSLIVAMLIQFASRRQATNSESDSDDAA